MVACWFLRINCIIKACLSMILKISNNNAVDFFIKEGGTPLEHQIFVYAFLQSF